MGGPQNPRGGDKKRGVEKTLWVFKPLVFVPASRFWGSPPFPPQPWGWDLSRLLKKNQNKKAPGPQNPLKLGKNLKLTKKFFPFFFCFCLKLGLKKA